MTKKKQIIHILGGGFNQLSLVKTAKELGLEVLVTDYFENPPCRALADHYERIDTTNKELSLEVAQKYKIDYVTSDQTDVAMPTVAYIAETLGLRGIGYQTALNFSNKYIMRKALSNSFRTNIPEHYYFDEISAAIDFCAGLSDLENYLVKPINSQGSKGVNRLTKDYQNLIKTAFDESKERGIMVEKFIGGFEFSVESFVNDSRVHNLTLTKKYHYASNPCIDERNTYLNDIDPDLESRIFDLNSRIIKELGLSFGSTHAEYKVERNNIYLIEIAARGAGGSIASHIIPYLTDFNPTEALLRQIMGQKIDIRFKDYKNKYAVLRFFNFAQGQVSKIHIDPSIQSKALVFTLDIKTGDKIRAVRDSRDRPGYFVVVSTDRAEVLELEKMLLSSVRVEYF